MKSLFVRNAAVAFIAGMGFMASPIYADMHEHEKGMMRNHESDMTQISKMMDDMAGIMTSMSGEMGKGSMSAAQQKHMAEHMRDMSKMMHDMSGMMGKGPMDAEHQKKMGEMRKQLDEMQKGAAPAARKVEPHYHPRDAK